MEIPACECLFCCVFTRVATDRCYIESWSFLMKGGLKGKEAGAPTSRDAPLRSIKTEKKAATFLLLSPVALSHDKNLSSARQDMNPTKTTRCFWTNNRAIHARVYVCYLYECDFKLSFPLQSSTHLFLDNYDF